MKRLFWGMLHLKSDDPIQCCGWIARYIVVFVFFLGSSICHGDELDELRVRVGVRLFPAFLAADQDIADKRGTDGALLLLLVHNNRPEMVEYSRVALEGFGKIRDFPIRLQSVDEKQLATFSTTPVAGIFLTQKLRGGLEGIILFAQKNRAIFYSPFDGDVEQGVMAGIAVTDKILPLVNQNALEVANIRIKPFFLKVAKLL